jgi:hypothetical protein
MSKEKRNIPPIGAIDLKRGESNLNIFFSGAIPQAKGPPIEMKEMICFDTTKIAVWEQLEGFALARK